MDVVHDLLERSNKNSEKYKSVEIDKLVDVDLGGLLVVDSNPFDSKSLKCSINDFILNLTRDNTQILFNRIWELPTERVDEAIVAKLPKQRFYLPRFKPVPKPRPLTKWQQFAKDKGIVKKKKGKLSWDEQLKKWVPLHGFKRAQAEKDKEWLIEVPQNVNPMDDQFAKKAETRSERVAKNELQRLRNIARARKVKVPRFGLTNPDLSSAKELQAAVTVAKSSTASLGKFQEKLPHEKEAKGVTAITPGSTRKRKLPPISGSQEKQNNLNIVDSVLNKRPKIDINKAVSMEINNEQQHKPRDRKESKGTSSRSNRKPNKSGKKPKSSNKRGKVGGRKRR